MSTQRAAQLLEAGLWLRLSGDPEGARRLFQQALKLDPTNARARQLLEGQADRPTLSAAPGAVSVSAPNPFLRPSTVPVTAGELAWDQATGVKPVLPTSEGLALDATSAWDSQANPGVRLSTRQPNVGVAMDLVTADAPPGPAVSASSAGDVQEEVAALIQGARELLELDDHSGAIELINKAQNLAPLEPEMQRLRERSEKILVAMFESKLGPLDARPRVALKEDEIIWLNLDHRAGFVLAQIDGAVTFEDVFAVSGMSRLDTARILAQLVEEGVIRR